MTTRRSTLLAIGMLIALGPGASRSPGHDGDSSRKLDRGPTVDEHWKLDFGFPGFDRLNKKLQRDFDDFREPTTAEMFVAMASAPAAVNAHDVGSWSPVLPTPVVAIHAALLVDGRLLFWDSVSDRPSTEEPVHDRTRAALLDPVTTNLTRVDNLSTGYNLFCAGLAHLPDGRVLIAGGNLNAALDGTQTIHFFDHVTQSWSLSPQSMAAARWYPSVTPLATGELLITSGGTRTHEVFTTEETLRVLSSTTLQMPLYPWLHAATNGNAFLFGPTDRMGYLNTNGTGTWQGLGGRDGIDRFYGSFAMFDIGKVFATGGGSSVRSSVVIDFMNPNIAPQVFVAADMANGRRQHNLTVLPDGTVLATGGNDNGAKLIDMNAGVYAAELWDPATNQWRVLASAARTRQYHSTAILLPDGRVFTGGGGVCGKCADVGYLENNYEIFSPPYLFASGGSGLAPRPEITFAPASVVYDESFTISTPDASTIQQVVMMRVASVTHSVDFEQRRVPLRFTRNGGTLNAVAPPNSNVAPPGFYMLFLIDDDGVPSVAEMVQVTSNGLGAPIIVAATPSAGAAILSWIPVQGATAYLIRRGTTPGQYTASSTVGSVMTHVVTGLAAGTRQYFAIAAVNGSETGGLSNEISVDIPASSGVTNLALGKLASQSTTEQGGIAPRAVDGNTNGSFSAGSVTLTKSRRRPWWTVDVGAVFDIGEVRLWNRTDCCSARLSNFRVFVSDVPFTSNSLPETVNQPGVTTYSFPGTFTGSLTIPVHRTGRFVRVQLAGTDYLSLAEVKVFSAPAAFASSMRSLLRSNDRSEARRPSPRKPPLR